MQPYYVLPPIWTSSLCIISHQWLPANWKHHWTQDMLTREPVPSPPQPGKETHKLSNKPSPKPSPFTSPPAWAPCLPWAVPGSGAAGPSPGPAAAPLPSKAEARALFPVSITRISSRKVRASRNHIFLLCSTPRHYIQRQLIQPAR